MSQFNVTLQSVINLAATHVDLLPLSNVGGYQNEPALSLCNDTLSDLLLSNIDWKFNRVEMPMLVTSTNRQDYTFAGASAFTLGSTASGVGIGLASGPSISQSSTTTTVTTLDSHRFAVGDVVFMTGNTVAGYNSAYSDNGTVSGWTGGWTITSITANTFVFTHGSSGLGTSGASGITDFGWLCNASMVNLLDTSSPPDGRRLQAVKELQPWSKIANPDKVCVLKDNLDGTLKIRFEYVPGTQPWAVNLVYQAKAPLKVALTDTWAPFPDHYSSVYRQGLMYRMYRYLNSPRADAEYQKLQAEIAKAQGASDREQTEVHLVPAEPLMDAGWL